MRRRDFLRTVCTTATVGVLGLAGCGGGGTTATPPGENSVEMYTKGGSYYFDPIGLHVDPGETVTWVNRSGQHSTTAYREGNSIAEVTRIPPNAAAWNSETLRRSGKTFAHTFEVEGTYDYFCVPHKALGMVGRVVVGEPGGPAEGGDPPDGAVPDSTTIVERGTVSYAEFRG